MCGIAGSIELGSGPRVSSESVVGVSDAMRARGPDAEGYQDFLNGRLQFAHRRLAVLDLNPRSKQPMSGDFTSIVFNGEIYNFQSLRAELEAKGERFRTTSDTEVILRLYEREGTASFAKLRGMFAFALWDSRESELFLLRDPFGIKPLYYHSESGTVCFASQLRALIQFPHVGRRIEPRALASFLLLGSVAEPFTVIEGVSALAPGHYLRISLDGSRQLVRFAESLPCDRSKDLAESFLESVSLHLVSDAPCGFFLSAGIDSSLLLAAASARLDASDLHAVTLGFEEFRGSEQDETVLAGKTAEALGVRHQVVWTSSSDSRHCIDELFAAMDQPSIDGMNSFLVSRAARQAGLTVALSGLGSDELLSGYPSFRQIPRMLALAKPFASAPGFGRMLRRFGAPFASRLSSPKYASLLEFGGSVTGAYFLRRGLFMPWEIATSFAPLGELAEVELQRLLEWSEWPEESGVNRQIASLEFSWYMRNQLLRDTDWASMASSLEVRVPFVDREFIAAAMSRESRKRELLEAVGQRLPAEVWNRPKTGFSVPLRQWLLKIEPSLAQHRGLRGWSLFVFERYCEQLGLDLGDVELESLRSVNA